MALFILVVMALIGTTLMQMLSNSNSAVAWEVLSNRALLAADSAAEMAMFQLFPPGQAEMDCSAVSTSSSFSDGLSGCTATVSCSEFEHATLGSHHYQIRSQGSCSAGEIETVRKVYLEARTPLP